MPTMYNVNHSTYSPGYYKKLGEESAVFSAHKSTLLLVSHDSPGAPPARTKELPPLSSLSSRPVYQPDPSIILAAQEIQNGAAYSDLEPRSPVTNALIEMAAKLLPTDVGPTIARYAAPLGTDIDGTALYPRITGTEHGAAVGELLDQYARTRFDKPDDPSLPTGAHVLVKQMLPQGATELPKVIDGNLFTRTLKIIASNFRGGLDFRPTQASSASTPTIAQVAGILAHVATTDTRAFSLLNQSAPHKTVIGGNPLKSGAYPFAFNVRADNKYGVDPYGQWEDPGVIGHDRITLPPGAASVEIRYDLFTDPKKYSFSELMRRGGQLTSNLVNEFVGSMKISRDANTTGEIKPMNAYAEAHTGS